MIPAPTRYARATDLDHALELLAEPDAKAIAGGQSLIPVMKLRIARPSLVVDISRLDLRGVTERDGELHVGPLTTWDELVGSAQLERPALAALVECARGIGDLQVRNLGTIGGSVVHADPASDMPAVLLALGARLRLRSPDGERDLAVADALVGPFTTALEAQELVTDIVIPVPAQGSGSAYACVEHPASGFALAGAAALVTPDGETVALTGIGAAPFVLRDGPGGRARSSATASPRPSTGASSPASSPNAHDHGARAREGGPMSDIIGVARPRIDAPDKVTGATRYAADGYVHGLLHARPVLASEAHARIRGFDTDAALAVPGVVAVLTAADLPLATTGTDRTSEPLAREEVVFAGQPVALVIAETEAAAEDGAELVVVDYEPLDAVVDVEAAMEPGVPLARSRRGVGRRGRRPRVRPRPGRRGSRGRRG